MRRSYGLAQHLGEDPVISSSPLSAPNLFDPERLTIPHMILIGVAVGVGTSFALSFFNRIFGGIR